MGDPIKDLYNSLKATNLFLDEADFRDQLNKSPKDMFGLISKQKETSSLFLDYDDFENATGLKKKGSIPAISSLSKIGGAAGSFNGPSEEFKPKTNAEKIQEYVSSLPDSGVKVEKQGEVKLINRTTAITPKPKDTGYSRPVFNSLDEYKADIETSATKIADDFEARYFNTRLNLMQRASAGDQFAAKDFQGIDELKATLASPDGVAAYRKTRLGEIEKELKEIKTIPVDFQTEDQKARLKILQQQQKDIDYSSKRVEENILVSNEVESILPILEENQNDPIALHTSLPTQTIGRNIIRRTMPQFNDVLEAIEKENGDVGTANSSLVYKIGLDAVANVIASNNTLLANEKLKEVVSSQIKDFDKTFPELTAVRVKHKIAAKLYEKSGWLYNKPPTVNELKEMGEAMRSAGDITPEEYNSFKDIVIPEEEDLWWGTNIPMNGLVNKLGEGFQQGIKSVTGLFDKAFLASNSDRVKEASNASLDTRYQDVGEYQEGKQRLAELNDKKELTADEKKQQEELETYVNVRNGINKFMDGTGGVTGQVLSMGITMKLAALPLSSLGRSFAIPYASNTVARMLQADKTSMAVGSFFQQYAENIDNAVLAFPKEEDKWKRRAYAGVISAIQAPMEGIFDDRKIFNVFSSKLAPEVTQFVKTISGKSITKEARKTAWTNLLTRVKQFGIEFAKETNNNALEEVVQGTTQGLGKLFVEGEGDLSTILSEGITTYTTTAMHSTLVAGMAAAGNVKQKATLKAGLYGIAKDPTSSLQEVARLLESKIISPDEAKDKIDIIIRANKIYKELPPKLGVPEKTVYTLHRLNESLLDDQIAATTDTVLIEKLKQQKDRSFNIRKGIFEEQILIGDNLSEMALTDKTAKELAIDSITTVPPDDAPYILSMIKDEKGMSVMQKSVDDNWKERIAAAKTEEEKEAIMAQHGDWLIGQGLAEKAAEKEKTPQEKINDLENEKADIEVAGEVDGLTEEDQQRLSEIDSEIEKLRKGEAGSVGVGGDGLKQGDKIQWDVYGNEESGEWVVGKKVKTRGGEDAVELTREVTATKYKPAHTQIHVVPLSELKVKPEVKNKNGETWFNRGTKINDKGEFVAKDGNTYTVSHTVNSRGMVSVKVKDANGKTVASSYFENNGDGTYSTARGSKVSSGIEGIGLAKSIYDYTDKNVGKIRKTETTTDGGDNLWRNNKPTKAEEQSLKETPKAQAGSVGVGGDVTQQESDNPALRNISITTNREGGISVKANVNGWVILNGGRKNEHGFYLLESPDGKLAYSNSPGIQYGLKIKEQPKSNTSNVVGGVVDLNVAQKYTINAANKDLPQAKEVDKNLIDWEASGLDEFDTEVDKVKVLETRGKNAQGQAVGTVRVYLKDGSIENFEVKFKETSKGNTSNVVEGSVGVGGAKIKLDPDLANIDPIIIAARNGDKKAQEKLEEYGLDWEQTTTYRFVGQSEVDVLLANNKVESKRGTADAGIDVTTSSKVTSAANNEYRVTFKESFDLNNGLGKVKLKSKEEGDHHLEKGRGYDINDVAKIERIDENGNVIEVVYEQSLKETPKSETTQSKNVATKEVEAPTPKDEGQPQSSETVEPVKEEEKPIKPQPEKWSTPSGKYTVEYQDGKRVVKTKRGKIIPETKTVKEKIKSGKQRGLVVTKQVANPDHTRILLQHTKSFNFNQGETSENKQPPPFNDAAEANRWAVENSENPAEIAAIYVRTEKQPIALSSTEAAIAHAGVGKVTKKSFLRFNDAANITYSIGKNYFSKDGLGLDQVALSASNYDEGVEVTPEDVANFMIRFPYGIDPDGLVKTDVHALAETKFQELTGIPLSSGNGRDVAAKLAASQFDSKGAAVVLEELDPLSEQSLPTAEIAAAEAWQGWTPVEETDEFDNTKTQNNEQKTQGDGAQAEDRANTGTESKTGPDTGGREGDGGGSDTGRSGSGKDSGENEEADYSLEDFQKEIDDIGDLEEAPFMAVSNSEGQLKAAQQLLAKAQRELSVAEGKITAKTQGKQQDAFKAPEAQQASMFGIARDEAKEILDPIREKVKIARAEVDRLATIVRDEQSQADGQISLFSAGRSYPKAVQKAFNKVRKAIEKMFTGTTGFKGVQVLTGQDFQDAVKLTGADTNFNFVGAMADFATARNSMDKAKEMDKAGENMENIFIQTGWYKDKLDGEWKYELPNNSRLLPVVVEPGKTTIYPLGDVLDYPELYEAYPEAKNVKVVFEDLAKNELAGGFYPKLNLIYLDNGTTPYKATNQKTDTGGTETHRSLTHEIQHYIQHKEGFARGASKDREGVRRVAEYTNAATGRINALKRMVRQMEEFSAPTNEIEYEIERLNDDLQYLKDDPDGAAEYFYKTYAGELEARNVERRMDGEKRKGSPNTTVETSPKRHISIDKGFNTEDPQFMSHPNGTIYGFVHKGVMYLNGNEINTNTPLHEAAHLFTRWSKVNAPELYAAGQRLAGVSGNYLSKVKNEPFYQKQAEKMREAGRTEAEIDEMFKDEALAFAVGDRGSAIVNTDNKTSFREWLKKFWNKIKSLFTSPSVKLEEMGAEAFSNMTFDDLSNLMAERILTGQPLAQAGPSENTSSFMTMPDGKKIQVRNIADATEVINGLYSPTENAINLVPQQKGTGNQWKTQLLSRGSSKEELQWTGLGDYLDENKATSISKNDVLQFLKDNRIEIVEVVKSDRPFKEIKNKMFSLGNDWEEVYGGVEAKKSNKDGDRFNLRINGVEYQRDFSYPDAKSYIEANADVNPEKNRSKFSQYQLEGEKTNYKEVLVTMPSATKVKMPKPVETYTGSGKYKLVFENGDQLSGTYTKEEVADVLKRRSEDKTGMYVDRNEQFKSSHFDEPNILVHLRMNTRKDADGNKILFLEEIQSDFGQAYKKEGGSIAAKKYDAAKEFYNKIWKPFQRKEITKEQAEKSFDELSKRTGISKEDIQDTGHEYGDFTKSRPREIPEAPFITETPSWTKLGLKVALKEAVKQGADKIAWSTGTQQFERWGSEKIDWKKEKIERFDEKLETLQEGLDEATKEGNREKAKSFVTRINDLKEKKNGYWLVDVNEQVSGNAFEGHNVGESALSESKLKVTSKDELKDILSRNLKRERNDAEIDKLTNRVWDRMQKEESGTSLPRKEGMEAFYGKPSEGSLGIVGEVAKSLFKQEPKTTTLQGEKPITTDNTTVERGLKSYVLKNENGDSLATMSFKTGDNFSKKDLHGELVFLAKKYAKKEVQETTQHSIDITPELKAEAEQGQPMFMATGNSKGKRTAEAAQKLLANGFTEDQVKAQLRLSGYSDLVAENIIANAKRLPKYKPLQPTTGPGLVPTPSTPITYEGDKGNWYDKKVKALKKWKGKYFSINKGAPELVLPLAEKTKGLQNWEVQQAYKTIKQLKEAAKKAGFTDWDKVDEALRGLKQAQQAALSTSTAITPFNPARAAANKPLTQVPALIPQVLKDLPESMRPIVLKMRAQIDGLTREMVSNGYVTPEQALTLEKNMGEYMSRAYAAFSNKNWGKEIPDVIKENALKFLYHQKFAEIKTADPTIPDEDAEKQASKMAHDRLQSILDGIDAEYSPKKTKTEKGRDDGILKRREDIPEPIRELLGEYKDPGEAFMMTIAKLAALRSQAKYLASVRDMGMNVFLWERDDINRPTEASVELRSSGTTAWFPLGGLYTTPEIAEYFNEENYLRNPATNAWMKLVGAVRWGKTVGSVVTQFKNFESNIGFAVMNGHFRFDKTKGAPLDYLWDQMKWWNGEKMDSDILDTAAKLGLIGQNVGVGELKEMFNDSNAKKIIRAAATSKDGVIRKISRTPGKVYNYLNKVYSASDDFFKLYGFISERDILANARFGVNFSQLETTQQEAINEEAAERVKNTYPTYDRVWEGPKYLSKNVPIFGNFLSFQAESIRVLMNTIHYAYKDLKDPNMRAAGARRLAGVTTYMGTRTAILYTIAQMTGFGMSTFFGSGDDDEEQKLSDINRFVLPFMRSGEKLVLPNGKGRYTVYDLTSLEPYGIWFRTINALRSGSENNSGGNLLSSFDEFLGPFGEKEMTFETLEQIWANDNGKDGRVYNPDDPAGNKLLDVLEFSWKKLEPSTIGFVKRMIERDNKSNEIMAFAGARGYDIDLQKSFSIKVFKAEEDIAALDKDYYATVRGITDGEKLDLIGADFDKKQQKIINELRNDYLAAIRLGADETALEERISKAYKKVFDPYQAADINIILTGEGEPSRYRRKAAGSSIRE